MSGLLPEVAVVPGTQTILVLVTNRRGDPVRIDYTAVILLQCLPQLRSDLPRDLLEPTRHENLHSQVI